MTELEQEAQQRNANAEAAAAFVQAWSEIGTVRKLNSGKIDLKSGGSYTYKYADLKTMYAEVRPILAANGFALFQSSGYEPKGARVGTRLIHTSGEILDFGEKFVPAGRMDDPKAYGSADTYARRYGLAVALGIATEDDDGAAASAKPAAKPRATAATNLASEKDRDALAARIDALPDHLTKQIGDKLRSSGVSWRQISKKQLKEADEWVVECEGIAESESSE